MAQNLTGSSGDLMLPHPCTSMANDLDEESNKSVTATYWENASLQSLLNYGASEIRRLHGGDEKCPVPSLVSKFKSFSRNRNLPERLEALCLYSSTFLGCEVTPEEHGFLKEDLSDLATTGINIHTLCSALPSTLSIFLDDERLSSSNLKKIEEMGQYVYMNHALSTEPFVAEVECQSEEALEQGETASETSPAVSYEVLGNTDNDMRNGQSFLEELKEETRLRHEFLWSRAEAVKCRQSLHLLGEFMRPFWFPAASGGVKSKYALDDTDMKCSVLEPLRKSSFDKTFIMEGPIEFTRPWGNLSVGSKCRCTYGKCYVCAPFKSVLHPEWQKSVVHDSHNVTKNMLGAEARTEGPWQNTNAVEDVIRTQWLNTPFSKVDRLIRNEISMSENSDGSALFEMDEDQLENENACADEDEVLDADLKEAVTQPRRKNRVYIHNAALAEKYAKKRLASKLKRRQINAHSKRRSTLIGSRKRLSAAERRKATIERPEQRVRRSRNRQRNEDLRPLENFVLEDPLYPSEKCDQGTDTADIEVPGIEREPTPTLNSEEDESDEDTSDEAYYQRHLPMETEEKVVNAERRRLMRAWMKRRQALLRRQESLSWSMGRSRSSSLNDSTADYPNGMGSPTVTGSPANTSVTIEPVDSPSAHSDESSE